MASDPPKPDPRVIAAYLDDIGLELDAARRLVADPPNRFAAFHLQQAAEKLIKAVRLGRGLPVTADHNLELLVDELAEDDPWRTKLRVLEPLSSFATAYRYPSPTGKRKTGPSNAEVLRWIADITALSAEARTAVSSWLGSREHGSS
ncbi:MAG TPA: HEPN domain-containing protein [Kofleriaceae bacterium]|nr:HEPN domain-containing protein [Kofleriaceae bacterium]